MLYSWHLHLCKASLRTQIRMYSHYLHTHVMFLLVHFDAACLWRFTSLSSIQPAALNACNVLPLRPQFKLLTVAMWWMRSMMRWL